jgi:23S rRNA (adenine2503-C2)-methyltransferase
VTAVVRRNRGQDISAACGQLAAEGGARVSRRHGEDGTPPLTVRGSAG